MSLSNQYSAEETIPASLALSCLLSIFKGSAQGVASWNTQSQSGISSGQQGKSLHVYLQETLEALLKSNVLASQDDR